MGEWVDVAIATIAKSRKEGLVVRCTAGSSFLLRPGMEVAFVPPVLDAPRRARVEAIERESGRRATVRFEGVDRAAAELLSGRHILVRRDELEPGALEESGGLAGFEVHDALLGFVGTVSSLLENPAHPLLEVQRPDGSTSLVPVVDEIVIGVDEQARRIDIDAPAGLFDL